MQENEMIQLIENIKFNTETIKMVNDELTKHREEQVKNEKVLQAILRELAETAAEQKQQIEDILLIINKMIEKRQNQ